MRYNIILAIIVTSLTTGILSFSTTAFSKSKTTDTIKFRQSGMMFMRWNMGIIKKSVIKNPDSYNEDKVLAAANVINSISHSGVEKLFTSETKTGEGWKKTRAKAEIFNQSKKVNEHMSKLKQETRKLVKASEIGNISTIKKQFKNVLRTCKGCHKTYRSK